MKRTETVKRLKEWRRVVRNQQRAQDRRQICHLNGVAKAFDMSHWDCGTAACALGSAGWDPWFRAKGLKTIEGLLPESLDDSGNGKVLYGRKDGERAAAAFFGITNKEAENIVLPENYPYPRNIEPREVIERLTDLIYEYSHAG